MTTKGRKKANPICTNLCPHHSHFLVAYVSLPLSLSLSLCLSVCLSSCVSLCFLLVNYPSLHPPHRNVVTIEPHPKMVKVTMNFVLIAHHVMNPGRTPLPEPADWLEDLDSSLVSHRWTIQLCFIHSSITSIVLF